MSAQYSSSDNSSLGTIDTSVSRLIFLAMLGLLAGGFVAFRILSKPIGPPPPEIARDALLTRGREIYLARCVACHGNDGRGDGPLAANLIGPPVGNLTDKEWKHGSTDGEIFNTIKNGVAPDFNMGAFADQLKDEDIWRVVLYVRSLAKNK